MKLAGTTSEPMHRDAEIETLLLGDFCRVHAKMDDHNYLFSRIALECAPTLMGIKPASLICFPNCRRNLHLLWQCYKSQTIQELGLQYFELKSAATHCSVLFYRHDALAAALNTENSISLLHESDYRGTSTVKSVLAHLRKKMESGFPHEIGLLLGIPAEDIRGFITNQGAHCLLCGYWKVYHDPQQAGILFKAYDNAKKAIMRRIIDFHSPLPAPI